ncbi:peptidoglycan recognition protein family protein [Tepidimicrobium xylanilyticum]|uniref:peptidoglycan recognition protein family protein n=1 Tax=Tepidimicrobium xylanilyticum TaxID=1123352 RepID=UPI00264B3BF4|nr:N-acetylmuramoyl-L-alanine amidase [Tepidimicrobium xylanilyticum]GMG96869.1 N-acetylmuramoyl-L-alanine amidase CwlA [Tepidimicrobium xylanilyticum]
MKIIQNLVSPSKYNIKCPYTMDPEYIVVHNTANDASARDEIAYMIRNNTQVSFHYAIDDKEIVQGIPENRNAWHAGDGNGQGNRKGIGIEICYSKSGGKRFEEAEKLAAKFIAYKLDEKNWGVDRVKKHQDFSGKYCPHRTLDLGWQRFLNMIQNELNKLKGAEKVTDKNKPSKWAEKEWAWAQKEGYLDGTRPKDPITREEMAIVLKRLVDRVG